MKELVALREFKLTSIREQMEETDRQLLQDLERGHGPALDAWISIRTPEYLRSPRPMSMKSRHRNARRRLQARMAWAA
ncbi:hypothetical protein [Aureimonas sp. ME7]|uniref:hypothetical protein n=1 Tax=Aureimonas sp. ME7 TaxID=2744252 RepID=UPI0015F78A67|nr:hypothetical protein [Aureimonas sp. ME7]